MPLPTKQELINQLHSLRLQGFDKELTEQAETHGFPAPFFFGIASRETNCTNELGDKEDGQCHGVGIVQIDIQYPIARQARDSGSWKTDPEPLIAYGASLLAQYIKDIREKFPAYNDEQVLKVAASAYNCGPANAIAGAQHGDSDCHTTGKDYGQDVMYRMGIFKELIAENA